MTVRTLSLSKVRANLSTVVRRADELFERTVITQKGKPTAIVIGYAEFESWQETLEILGAPALMANIQQADRELAQGHASSYRDVFGRAQPGTE